MNASSIPMIRTRTKSHESSAEKPQSCISPTAAAAALLLPCSSTKFDSWTNRSLYSPFYRRPMSLASSSLARSLSSSHLNPGIENSLEVFPRWMQQQQQQQQLVQPDTRSYASVHVGSSSLELGELPPQPQCWTALIVQSNRCSFIATGFSNRVVN